jgi:farnesyl diphosphate synthase
LPSTANDRLERALRKSAAETDLLMGKLIAGGPAPRLLKAMRYAALSGGKRLRPFLVSQSAALFGVPRQRASRVGAALECVHCYSLAHDDLPAMDDDDMRRGRPSTHKQFDEATAILAGDALLTLAFEILADPKTHPEAKVRAQLVSSLAIAAGHAGMAGGQMLDIEAEKKSKASIAAIKAIQSNKTGALFRFACEAGAHLAETSPARLIRYANHIGLAFQVADDLLDVESTPETLGKATQKDARSGKATFVSLLGAEKAKALAQSEVHAAIAALAPYGAKADLLRDAARFIVARKT